MAGLIEGQGGTLRYNAEVSAIAVEGGTATGVTLANGEHIPADIVVSNADSAWTYRYLLPPLRPPPLDEQADREIAFFDGAVRLVFRHEPQI